MSTLSLPLPGHRVRPPATFYWEELGARLYQFPHDYVPVAEDIMAAEDEWREYNRQVRATAFRHFARKLNAVLDDAPTMRKLNDLAVTWELEALL